MAKNRDWCAGRLLTWIAFLVTVAVIALLLLLLYARWAEVKSAKALQLVSALGGVGTFLALIWLICGHLQQAAQFRAQIKSAYEGSLQPTIVFRNTGADWLMLNAGKGTAINVEVYGAFEKGYEGNREDSWEPNDSFRFSALSGQG